MGLVPAGPQVDDTFGRIMWGVSMTGGFAAWLSHRSFGVVTVTVSLMIAFSTSADAQPPPPQPTPTQCLEAFSSDPNYVGDGWVGARVSGPPPPMYLGGVRDPVDREFSLFCGDELSGVVHIAHPESTGTVHPISREDESFFVDCWSRIISRGIQDPEGDRTRFTYQYGQMMVNGVPVGPLTATAIVDNQRRLTYTVFTGGGNTPGRGNDWFNCAHGPGPEA